MTKIINIILSQFWSNTYAETLFHNVQLLEQWIIKLQQYLHTLSFYQFCSRDNKCLEYTKTYQASTSYNGTDSNNSFYSSKSKSFSNGLKTNLNSKETKLQPWLRWFLTWFSIFFLTSLPNPTIFEKQKMKTIAMQVPKNSNAEPYERKL